MGMKKFITISIILFISGILYAQQEREVGAINAERLGIESAQQELKEISVDKFEHDGFWRSSMSTDEGYVISRLFSSVGSQDKQPIPDEEGLDIPDRHVLGTRVDYLRRGHNSFLIYPARPIPVEGITKTLSMWVAGRNFNHDLYVLIQDFFGRNYEFFMGKLNFMGWKKLVVAVPPQSEDGFSGVIQRNYHYNNQMGIKIMGFRVVCNLAETYGSYYIYFDDLRAVTDLFTENNRDSDDMVDGW